MRWVHFVHETSLREDRSFCPYHEVLCCPSHLYLYHRSRSVSGAAPALQMSYYYNYWFSNGLVGSPVYLAELSSNMAESWGRG